MKIKILTEGGKSLGLGHLSRCSSLYEEISRRNIPVEFVINGNVESVNFLKEYPLTNINWLNGDYLANQISKNDTVIVDSYQATKDDYDKIKNKAQKLLIIDDNGRICYPEGIIVNPSLYVDNIDYSYANKNNLFLGPKYVIVRSAFVNDGTKIIQDEIKKVLIMMGGTDVRNLTSVLVKRFVAKYQAVHFDVVINDQSFQKKSYSKEFKNVDFHSNITDIEMSQLMRKSDFAITAAGQSIYELMATQTPFLAIQVIDNQRNNVVAINKLISSDVVFQYDEKKLLTKLEDAFNKYIDRGNRKQMVQKQRQLIDGKGSQRIIDALIDGAIKEIIILRDATFNDIKQVYTLSNEYYVRRHSINKTKISWNDHRKWFEETIKDEEVVFYIVTNENDDFLGQIRYSIKGSNATISLSLSNEIRGKGLASHILAEGIKKVFNENIYLLSITAFVSEENKASKKIFENLGFIRVTNENSLLKYQLRRIK